MIDREQLLALVDKRVDITHGGVVDAYLLILDVGEKYVFGRRPDGIPDPIIPIEEIQRVSWNETTRRELKK